jgi:hypothetical protein
VLSCGDKDRMEINASNSFLMLQDYSHQAVAQQSTDEAHTDMDGEGLRSMPLKWTPVL